MNKILRYSFIALLAFICNVSFAETIIWSEDFSSYEADAVPTGGTYKYVCTNGANGGGVTKIYKEKFAGGEAPELLIGKKKNASSEGGSFSATVPLNGITGNITLRFKANNNVTVEAKGATVGTQTKTGNDFSYPLTVTAGTTSITITITTAVTKNVRLDNIKLFQGEGKQPAGLSWGTSSRTVTIGAEDNLFPTLSNTNNLSVTYTSSNTDVATINDEGTITLVAAGETTITASFAGNDTYEKETVSYTLTVKGTSTVDITNTPETAYSVAKAKELIAAGEGLDTKVYVKGIVSKASKSLNDKYGSLSYYISDDGKTGSELYIYGGLNINGEKFTSVDDVPVGAEIVAYGKLKKYNTTDELDVNNVLISIKKDTSNITEISANETAKNAPAYNLAGQKVSNSYKGVVIKAGKKFVQK